MLNKPAHVRLQGAKLHALMGELGILRTTLDPIERRELDIIMRRMLIIVTELSAYGVKI